MRRIRTRVGTVAVAATAALTLAACSGGTADDSAGGDVIDVDFGYIADFNGTSLLAVADDQDLWAEHGLDVTTSSFTNGPLQIQALGTGDLDFGYIGPGAFWLPASGQAKVVAINTLGRADRVVAQPGIDSLEDLEGRTVAVPEGTSGDMILTLALESVGLTKDDVEIVPMDAATIVSAFGSGQVDAAGIWYPALDTIKQQVPDLVELAENTDFQETTEFPTAFVAGNDVVEDEEMTSRVLAVLREAMQFRSENMEETIDLTAAMLQLTPEQVAADAANVEVLDAADLDAYTADGTVDTWLSSLGDFFVGSGQLPDAVDPSTYYLGDLFVQAGE
jgi:NitT/TauT family transport system substrate-binding protein